MATSAILYDGDTARRQRVLVDAGSSGVVIVDAEHRRTLVPTGDLMVVDGVKDTITLAHQTHEGWRLIIPEPVSDGLAAVLPKKARYGGFIDRIGLAPALIALAGISALVLVGAYAAPAAVAPLVPTAWEDNLGDAMVGDFGDRRCRSPEAEAAVTALIDRLAGPEAAARIEPAILDVDWENAAALPGAHIVLFDGAIDRWENPDALAGVIAHEIAHVEERHVTEALVRELGIGALLRLFADDVGAEAQNLVALSYSRGNESEADEEAIRMMEEAGISLEGVAELFDDFAGMGDGGRLEELLSSHPVSEGRADKFRAAAEAQGETRPAFTDAEWDAIRNACDPAS
ncbi:M48 family metallopeptidase [Sphingomicrobium sediminis]|uniref:M48 family metallopeptidase n=1 Tax=Sphingomicrobium sediminis TaxID=2950949 RepID=A0A9X2J3C3_9SPHN|nr:M48 family metallopeptidase [Sphingomicrobium sediminis]MCM8557905.1 M48 family metallopeptidase [Sphingomicrobium sediminis]